MLSTVALFVACYVTVGFMFAVGKRIDAGGPTDNHIRRESEPGIVALVVISVFAVLWLPLGVVGVARSFVAWLFTPRPP